MPTPPTDRPITKVTLNLYTEDVQFLKAQGNWWTTVGQRDNPRPLLGKTHAEEGTLQCPMTSPTHASLATETTSTG